MKWIFFLIMLGLTPFAQANDKLAKLCSHISMVVEDATRYVKDGENIEWVDSYRGLEDVYGDKADFIQKDVKEFIMITSTTLTPELAGGFFLHACYNSYLQNKGVIKELKQYVRHYCPSGSNRVKACIDKSVKEYLIAK
ncbi:hypothetical protein [Psychromonas sp.]|uniref:hypothetical protein n=1 Tax=Psychromonas sp. TaxID=1884585 RepID=UPI003A97AD88